MTGRDPGPGSRDPGTGPKAAAEGRPKPVQPPSTNMPRDEISRSGEPLTPIQLAIDAHAWCLKHSNPEALAHYEHSVDDLRSRLPSDSDRTKVIPPR